jgi:hypothetical protein
MGKYKDEYSHGGWTIRFAGKQHADGMWDDSANLELHEGGTAYGVPLLGKNRLADRDEAVRVCMISARRWIDAKGLRFLSEKRRQGL